MKDFEDSSSQLSMNQGMAELSHELGNVLNGLLGMTQLVRESALTAEQDRWLRAIEQSGQQLRQLVDRFRPGNSADHSAFPASRIDGIELLEQVVLSHAPAALDGQNRLLLIVDPALPRFWQCDSCRLRQLLDNLLGNALKFTRSGEVAVEAIMTRPGPSGAGTLVLAVADNGPGIGSELAQRMFGAYEQGPQQVREGAGGHGLGLHICRKIARVLGGEISWSSRASGGARFELSIPGVFASTRGSSADPGRILQSVCCHLDLSGPLLRSVGGWLTRLGVRWRVSGPAGAQELQDGDGESAEETLQLTVREMEAGGDHPGPRLLLRKAGAGNPAGYRSLPGPVLECNLAPLLLELALQSLWVRNERPGSVPRQPRSGRSGDPGSHRE